MKNSRPADLTIVALLLGCLSLGGFGNALMMPKAIGRFAEENLSGAPMIALFFEQMESRLPVFTFVAFTYGVTALLTAIGAWTVQHTGMLEKRHMLQMRFNKALQLTLDRAATVVNAAPASSAARPGGQAL